MQTQIQNLIPQSIVNQLIVLEGELISTEAVAYADEVRFGWQYDNQCHSCGKAFDKTEPNQFFCAPCFDDISRSDNNEDLPF